MSRNPPTALQHVISRLVGTNLRQTTTLEENGVVEMEQLTMQQNSNVLQTLIRRFWISIILGLTVGGALDVCCMKRRCSRPSSWS